MKVTINRVAGDRNDHTSPREQRMRVGEQKSNLSLGFHHQPKDE